MLNVAVILGRLTADPELRITQSGISVCSFTVAVDRDFTDESGNRQADFINCVAWRQTAEFVSRYFGKGKMIGVKGAIQTRNYEDKNGNKRTAVEIKADSVSFAGDKDKGQQPSQPSAGSYAQTNTGASPPRQASQPGRAAQQPYPPYGQPAGYQQGSFDDYQEITPDEDLPF